MVAHDCFFDVDGMMLVLNQQELTQVQFATEKVQLFEVSLCKFSSFFTIDKQESNGTFLMFFRAFFL